MHRIFIAIDLPDNVKRLASDQIASLKDRQEKLRVSWVSPDRMHLTLRFLGDVESEVLPSIHESLDRAASRVDPFHLTLSGAGLFPNPKRPSVLWMGIVDPHDTLRRFKADLDNELGKFGFDMEKRRFRPHLTIARLREPNRSVEIAAAHLDSDLKSMNFEVGEIAVFQSRLGPEGPKYIRQHAAGFGI